VNAGLTQSRHDGTVDRVRINTSVDRALLERARRARPGVSDAELIDEALTMLPGRDDVNDLDWAYARAYAAHPLDEPDEWGNLASFRDVVAY
jgi:hypothetical protein